MKRQADEAAPPFAPPEAITSAGGYVVTRRNDMGRFLCQEDRFEEAARCVRAALRVDPESDQGTWERGDRLAGVFE